jgi:branched-chain amino acid transport system ATP-binding protein
VSPEGVNGNTSAELLRVERLVVGYRGAGIAVHGVDLSIRSGEVAVVLGSNGAGKTTMLRGIAGFWRSEPGRVRAGHVYLEGKEVTRQAPSTLALKGVALVPQDPKVFRTLTVEENLLAVPVRGGRNTHRELLDEVLDFFPRLRERTKTTAGFLSGGERQMLALARALLMKPKLLLIDEASLGLSPAAISDVFMKLKETVETFGATILLVEQDVEAALGLADTVHVIETGSFVFSGTPAEVSGHEEIRRTYLGLRD